MNSYFIPTFPSTTTLWSYSAWLFSDHLRNSGVAKFEVGKASYYCLTQSCAVITYSYSFNSHLEMQEVC